jgi:hypothetical protein
MADLQNLSISLSRQLPTEDDVCHHKSMINEIDIEIEDLEARIRSIREKREIYACYISPFRRLSTEVLREIADIAFINGIDIMTIAQICRRLRNVAFGMTTIWSEIRLRSNWSRIGPTYGHYRTVFVFTILYIWY